MAPEIDQRPFTQMDLLQMLNRQTEAGNALVVSGLVEDWLEKLLLAAGRSLTNADAGRIFGMGGPLSGFAPKIEIAYMFELLDDRSRDDLRLIKSIRNAFAHTTRFVYFETDHIAQNCRKLSNWKDGLDNQTCYRENAVEHVNAMKAHMDRLLFAQALRAEPTVKIDDED
jgi:hypothetical protein